MPHQQATLPLLRGGGGGHDMLLDLDYPEQRIDFFVSLYSNRGDIEDIVSYHLGLGRSETCRLADVNEWVHGSFNFTKPENTPFTNRIPWSFKRYISWLLGSTPSCNYVCHRRLTMLESGYLLMDYVGNAEMQLLPETWDEDHHHRDKRINLFRGLSRIMLSLSQIPLPRIESWTLDANGALRLSNRPLTLRLHQTTPDQVTTGGQR
ncbi:hypothetical protein BDV24DRAFT_150803 [Aspergillus arachidicola]|uniref:Uncharacterized protein n=1 Tax=Aspergillus arachidicola TaxID=656916 RepID=A0A5N6Y992_9EURO|nr:hypothetical protein BDV24DRAFT_150803 [Aspergillus arachidicola]